jgi:DNA repair protein RadC
MEVKMGDNREERMDGLNTEKMEQVPTLQRVIDGKLYTVKVHFRDGVKRTAKETMKSILVHEIDAKAGSEGGFD